MINALLVLLLVLLWLTIGVFVGIVAERFWKISKDLF